MLPGPPDCGPVHVSRAARARRKAAHSKAAFGWVARPHAARQAAAGLREACSPPALAQVALDPGRQPPVPPLSSPALPEAPGRRLEGSPPPGPRLARVHAAPAPASGGRCVPLPVVDGLDRSVSQRVRHGPAAARMPSPLADGPPQQRPSPHPLEGQPRAARVSPQAVAPRPRQAVQAALWSPVPYPRSPATRVRVRVQRSGPEVASRAWSAAPPAWRAARCGARREGTGALSFHLPPLSPGLAM